MMKSMGMNSYPSGLVGSNNYLMQPNIPNNPYMTNNYSNRLFHDNRVRMGMTPPNPSSPAPNPMLPRRSSVGSGLVSAATDTGMNQLNDGYYHYNPGPELFSRKVFVGGLPIDITEEELTSVFGAYGNVVVDWPHKNQLNGRFPPRGYVFLVFELESSVQNLVKECYEQDHRFYILVSSPTMRDKPVQIRPWKLADADFVVDTKMSLDPRKTIFIGGVPRPLKAVELANIMDRLYGGVCYAGIDTDPELKYPKGAGRVAFTNHQSFMAAIAAKFVHLRHTDVDKRVEVKPYILDEQMCDECGGSRCGGKYAPYFCPDVSCLQYYCQVCWSMLHGRTGRDLHRPLIKENMERRRRSNSVSGGLMAFPSPYYGGGHRPFSPI